VESLAALRAFELGGLYVCFGGRKFLEGGQQDRKLVIAYYLFCGREERGAPVKQAIAFHGGNMEDGA
jgi:hypothetical protein